MIISRADTADLETLHTLTRACAEDLIGKGIFQWNDYYPSTEILATDIARQELWKLVYEGQLIGMIVLTTLEDAVYTTVQWPLADPNPLYIHRLAVQPAFQGKGFAQKLMDFAETHASDQQYSSLRLDTFSMNKRNQRFYEQRGYQQCGLIYFAKQSEHPFYCYR